jgi:hypothetical protein
MPRPKSILMSINVGIAQRAHNCQHNQSHRIVKGDKRLEVSEGRNIERFCVECALSIVARDISKLQELQKQLQ